MVIGIILFFLEPQISKKLKCIGKKFDSELSAYSQVDIILGSVGLLIGFIIAFFLSGLLEKVYIVGPVLAILAYVVFGLIGIRIGIRSKPDIASLIKMKNIGEKKEKDSDKLKKNKKMIPPKVLDTSVIIDGRIADI